jgi:hypothetical protein
MSVDEYMVQTLKEEPQLTPIERLTCLLALQDDVIKKDAERTQGDWNQSEFGFALDVEGAYIGNAVRRSDASFIASASVSHGKNARMAKKCVERFITLGTHDEIVDEFIQSLYPDEILRQYLK